MIDLKWSKFIHNLCPVEPEPEKKPFDIVWLTEGLDVLRMFSFTCGCLVIVSQPVAGLDDARWLDGVRVSIVFHMIPSGKLT